jgi:hypothetical protein
LNNIHIRPYVDGNEPDCLEQIKDFFIIRWSELYKSIGVISFLPCVNVKEKSGFEQLPDELKQAFLIRNPDVFFVAEVNGRILILGGIEITVHSPDGSNVEKRYPFIWCGRRFGFNAFIACPYMKTRPGGQQNKLPNRHSKRNLDFINAWQNDLTINNSLQQIVPINELQENIQIAEGILKHKLLEWKSFSDFFCDYLALLLGSKQAQKLLEGSVKIFESLVRACLQASKFTEPSSFIDAGGDRWIQVYNTRPDSGHWERGEGQFDSIDGRLMFTLDQAELNEGANKLIEFWLPQFSKKHPWVIEQISRNYGSKRFRNINQILNAFITIKFAEDLTEEDLVILLDNPSLTLERLDWPSDVYNVYELLSGENASVIARKGLKNPSKDLVSAISNLLSDKSLFLSTHRLYGPNWRSDLENKLSLLPKGATIIIPRIPSNWMNNLVNPNTLKVIFADECTKIQLLALRQLHRQCFN